MSRSLKKGPYINVKLFRKLQAGITYQIPMGDSFEWKDAGAVVTAKNKTWQVSLAYIF